MSSDRYPSVRLEGHAPAWLTMQADLGRASNTIDAYGRGLQDFLCFAVDHDVDLESARREDIALYVRDLIGRPNPRGANRRVLTSSAGLANATLVQRLTVVRLFFDYLVEEGVRVTNPVGRGRNGPGRGGVKRSLLPRYMARSQPR